MGKRKALGKGLSAIIPEAGRITEDTGDFFQCPVEKIEPNPYQPRQTFDEKDLEELVKSVKEKGIITPLLVSKAKDGYQLIAGERRWRAAKRAGLERVPVVIRETTPIESLELAIIENIHRSDLNPIEEAAAYRRWLDDTNTTQEELAKNLGRDRTTITNTLRLLNLPTEIQQDLIDNKLSMGHARVLAGLQSHERQKEIRDLIIKKSLSVRQTEEAAKKEKRKKPVRAGNKELDDYLQSIADNLKRSIGTKVDIKNKGKKGSIIIHYYSDEELERLIDLLS